MKLEYDRDDPQADIKVRDSKSPSEERSGGQTVYLHHNRYLHNDEDECCFVLGYN
jgi:hypothetical protein